MKVNRNDNRIDTTLGDLIVTISDVAFEYAADTKEAYNKRSHFAAGVLTPALTKGNVQPPFGNPI